MLNLEARIKITENIGIVPFVDAGSYYESPVPQLGRTLLYGVGLGLRYYTALRAAAARPGDPAAQAQRRLADPGLYQPRSGLLMQQRGESASLARHRARPADRSSSSSPFSGCLQTQLGKAWLARDDRAGAERSRFHRRDRAASAGFVPFRMTVERIEIGDRDGTYLTLRDVGLDISAAALLAGTAHIRSLTIAEIDMARSSHRAIDDAVHRIPQGSASSRRRRSRPAVDRPAGARSPGLGRKPRRDGRGKRRAGGRRRRMSRSICTAPTALPGISCWRWSLPEHTPVLSLRLDAAEPTGVLLDRLLGRTDRLPLALSVNGTGPLADWHGRVSASAGTLARFDADVTLAVSGRDRSRAIGHGGIGAAAPAGVRAAGRRPGRALAARDIRRPDRRRSAVDRNRGGHVDRRCALWRPGTRPLRRICAPMCRSSRRFAGLLGQPLERLGSPHGCR